MVTKSNLRKAFRAQRRNLTQRQQLDASINLQKNLNRFTPFRHSKKIALYVANDGEIDPRLLLQENKQRRAQQTYFVNHKDFHLPVLHPFKTKTLIFLPYPKKSKLRKNRYGIPEPKPPYRRQINPRWLDLILIPLVAFDAKNNRLGMGGGYYDRTFAFKQRSKRNLPKLIGVAHRCQYTEQLPCEPWDLSLDAIITD